VLVTSVAVIAAAIVYVVVHIPSYRTAFLIDTAASTPSGAGADFHAVADAVSSAAQNVGDGDALSLRRFGGACGDSHNTDQIVSSGTHHGQQISDAVHTLTPSGAATLQSGIFAAIDDFSGFYPFRGRKSNRIIVVSSHGIDACTADQVTLLKRIRDRVDAAGLQLDFRFVGYKIPSEQQHTLTQVAAATGAPEPKFTQTAAGLTEILKQLTIPESPDAAPVRIPNSTSKITVVPVDKSVNPLPGYRVTSRADIDYDVDCGSPQSDPSPVSVGANIVFCGTYTAPADVCWTRPDRRTVLCGRDPWDKVLYQYTARDSISSVSAAKDPLPWGLELEDGTKCRFRDGGAWAGRSDNLIGYYDCGADRDPVLAPMVVGAQAASAQVIDKSLPTWTVKVGPLEDSTASPPPRKLGIVVAYFAGSPS
jgi:hypothetical protein